MAEKSLSLLMLLRKQAGLTQQDLADILGVTKNTVSRWELGNAEAQLTLRQVKLLCNALRISVDQLPDSFAPQPIPSHAEAAKDILAAKLPDP